jgi:ABC-type glutathione transport system ATPase component
MRLMALVTIAHRLDTVRRADHVIVLEVGRVLDEGPPGEVLARYREGVDEVLVGGGVMGGGGPCEQVLRVHDF